jgi:hypothetical protein
VLGFVAIKPPAKRARQVSGLWSAGTSRRLGRVAGGDHVGRRSPDPPGGTATPQQS